MRLNPSRAILTALALCVTAFLGGGCGDDAPAQPSKGTCTTSRDCDLGATTAGQVCIDGACTECFTDASCQSDARYGSTSTCTEGRCSRCEPGSLGCGCDGDSCQSGECVAGRCADCQRGELACACRSNGSCDGGATCLDDVCAPCTAGALGCPCDGTACEADLVCQGGVCADVDCQGGEEGCPCDGERCDGGLSCGDDGMCRACAPDVEGCPCNDDDTCDGDLGCDDGTCVPCSPALAGCPCADDDTCEGVLVCDSADDTCRQAIACADLGCGNGQLCQPASDGVDAMCLEDCLPGFQWSGTTCVPDGTATSCTPGEEGSLAEECSALNRLCEVDAGVASCTTCQSGTTDEGMALQTCRPTRACADLDCAAQNRDCAEAHDNTDATCTTCRPGTSEQGGVCVASATCTPNVEGSIAAECDGLQRLCEETGPNGAACGECFTGLVEDGPGGMCRAPIPCADRVGNPDLACPTNTTCYDLGSTRDSECRTRACLNPREASPPPPASLDCTVCTVPATCLIEGQTGDLDAWRTLNNQCVCQTLDGYFADLSEDGAAKKCDRDGDGWVNLNGYQATRNADPTIAQNARCTIRTVDRVVLQNEWGQRLPVYACEGAQPWSLTPCVGPRRLLPLVEPAVLDDVDAFNAVANLEGTLPAYAFTENSRTRGRRLRVEELNPLTKACVDRFGDFNANKRADYTEYQSQAPDTTLPAELRTFVPFAAFVELHRFAFEARANFVACPLGAVCGDLVISERSRAEVDFPVQPDADANGYWRDCTRSRDAAYAEDAVNAGTFAGELSGFDFGRFSEGCASNVGGCTVPPPPLPRQPVTSVPPHGLRDLALPLPIDAAHPWRGMTHHSQFKCVSLDNDIVTGTPTRRFAQQRLNRAELFNGANPTSGWVLNRCTVTCPDGDPTCATDCAGPTCTTSSEAIGQGPNPRAVRLSCEPLDTAGEVDGLLTNTVGFAAVRYLNGNGSRALPRQDYLRGCINEWDPQLVPASVAAWRSLCPGYIEAPRTTFGLADIDQYGKILCGCDVNYGGPTCQTGCADPLFGGAADSLCSDNHGYCPVKPTDDGGRAGAWICGGLTATSYPPDSPPFLQEGPALIEGNVHIGIRASQPMCEQGGDCSDVTTGPVIR